MKSCYIHIPFCKSICSYCDFCKMFYNKEFVNSYLDELEKEIREVYNKEELETIYIGGGTPSILSLEELKRLFDILKIFKKKDNIEYTIEGNFDSTTKEKLELYKENGVNRLSFGLESINPKNQEFLNRHESKENIKEVIENARSLGFHNINIDLIYALPTEDKKVLQEDLDYVFSCNPEHISTYSLIIEEHTVLFLNHIKNIEEDLDSEMYDLINHEMKKHKYNHYEISNYAKNGYQSKHNTTYWNNEEYYGFGLGASSYRNNTRIENTRSLTEYLKGNRIKNKEELSKNDKIEYEILLNLRKSSGISLLDFEAKYKRKLQDICNYQELVTNGFLKEEKNHLFIPEEKFYISNEIIVQLLERITYE